MEQVRHTEAPYYYRRAPELEALGEEEFSQCNAPGSLDTSLSHAAGLIEIVACHA